MTMLKSLLAATALSLAARGALPAQVAAQMHAKQEARILGAHDGAPSVERTTVTTERAGTRVERREVRDDRREVRDDRKALRHDRRELQRDERDLRHDRHDRRDWAHDRNDARKAAKAHKHR